MILEREFVIISCLSVTYLRRCREIGREEKESEKNDKGDDTWSISEGYIGIHWEKVIPEKRNSLSKGNEAQNSMAYWG